MPVSGASDPRPRILLLIKGLGLGGAERLLVDVVGAGDQDRFEYEVAYVLDDQRALVASLEGSGVPVHGLGATASADLRWTVALRRLLAERRYDVVHAHLPYTAAFGRLVALTLPRGRRPALVYTEHSLWDKAARADQSPQPLDRGPRPGSHRGVGHGRAAPCRGPFSPGPAWWCTASTAPASPCPPRSTGRGAMTCG